MKAILVVSAFLFSTATLAAEQSTLSTKSQDAPAAKASKLSFGYSYYHYSMEGTSTANTNIYKFGDASVDLQLYSLTYTASPKWTVMAIAPYIRNQVETVYEPVANGLNMALTDTTEGMGDVRIMAIAPSSLLSSGKIMSMFDLGFTVPTGKTDSTFTSAPTQRASYNMQLGSGTPDLILGLTSMHLTTKKWIQSAHVGYTDRMGRNSHGWALGDEIAANASSKFQAAKWLNTGMQFNYKNRGKVEGREKRYELFNNFPSPTGTSGGDGHQYYHQSQINYDLTAMAKAEYKISVATAALEVGIPLWQDAKNADNIRLDTRYYISGSASAAF